MAVQGSEWNAGAIVPHLAVNDLNEAVEFYKRAFGAMELYRSPRTSEYGEYASLKIWTSIVMVSAELRQEPPEKPELGFVASPERLGGTTCVCRFAFRMPTGFTSAPSNAADFRQCRFRTGSGEIATDGCATHSGMCGRSARLTRSSRWKNATAECTA